MPARRTPVDLDLGATTPEAALERARERGRALRLRGLRMRVKGEQIRARYVLGAASDASILVAQLEPRQGHTHLVGEMRWAAMYASFVIRMVAPTLLGVAVFVWTLFIAPWVVTAGVAVFTISMGWMSVLFASDIGENQRIEQGLLEVELRKVLG